MRKICRNTITTTLIIIINIIIILLHICVAQKNCDLANLLHHNFTYIPPSAFKGGVWNSEHKCIYQFLPATAETSKYDFQFKSPKNGCLNDPWDIAYGILNNNNMIHIQYHIMENNTLTNIYTAIPSALNCQFLDIFLPSDDDDNNGGGMYVKGHGPGQSHPMDFSLHDWLRTATAWVVRSSIVTFRDKTQHLSPGIPVSPDGTPHYNGQWMRDSFYGISMGWDLVNKTMQTSFLQSAEWMFSHARKDGILPVSCQNDAENTCYYENPYVCNDTVGSENWQLCQDLDTSSFATKLFSHIWKNYDYDTSDLKKAFYLKWKNIILNSLDKTTKDPESSGLIWSNISFPQVGYGFQDNEIKSGNVLYSSILYWNATLEIAAMAEEYGDLSLKNRLEKEALKIQESASKQLWNDNLGVFMASTGLEKTNIDLWVNAMAGAINFANEKQSIQIYNYFKQNENDIFYEGQVREIPFPTQWTDKSIGKSIDPMSTIRIYQNGGYWATPHHHVLPFLGKYDKEMACRLLNDTIRSFRGHGINEWVGPFWPSSYIGAPGYVASATNTYFASEHLRCWEV